MERDRYQTYNHRNDFIIIMEIGRKKTADESNLVLAGQEVSTFRMMPMV